MYTSNNQQTTYQSKIKLPRNLKSNAISHHTQTIKSDTNNHKPIKPQIVNKQTKSKTNQNTNLNYNNNTNNPHYKIKNHKLQRTIKRQEINKILKYKKAPTAQPNTTTPPPKQLSKTKTS